MTALAVSGREAPAHPAGSMARLAWHQFRYDLRAVFRNRRARFFTLALPMLFLVIVALVFTRHQQGRLDRSTSLYYVPSSSRWRSSAPHSAI